MRFISRLKLLCVIASVALFSSGAAIAAEPPNEPILRIDPGEHTAIIRHVASDANGRWLATTSNDKTVRLWDLADGKQIATLRPPIGPSNEGKLYSVAMSPDGNTVAVSGWTQFANGSSLPSSIGHSIYLFERASGRMLFSIKGLSSVVNHLSFSPDGRWLAAALGAGEGLRIFDTASGQLLAEDRNYGGGLSYSVYFSNDGRLVTASTDGLLRLYSFDGRTLSLLATRAAPDGKTPRMARFSPDGKHIAVAFSPSGSGTTGVNVVDARSLSLDYVPDTSEIGANQSFNQVEWSKDGMTLFATGNAGYDNEHIYIRSWSQAGRGASVNNMVARDSILDLLALPDGRLVFSGGAPEWGVINQVGQRALYHGAGVADYRNLGQDFTLSADGTKVRFAYEYGGKSPAVFDILSHSFLGGNSYGFIPPQINAYGLDVRDWKETDGPTLNGARLTLHARQFEFSRSLALLPRSDGLVLGTDTYLYLFDRNGSQRWKQSAPGAAWAVNVSQDGRWVVAAYADGTIRWHRASDGVEQLAFFPHPDKKRWIMWTPSGYYDASPGAEDLIGWHVNRGKDQAADFFPASRFRDRFHRPDVLSQVLNTQDEGEALRLANAESGRRTQTVSSIAQELPPVVEIVSPAQESTVQSGTIKVRYTVRTAADAPVTAMRVRVNGLLQTDGRNLQVAAVGDNREITVNLPEQDAEVQLFAENKYSVSTPAILRLKWAGKATAHQDSQPKPTLYVLAVGVSKYKNPDYNLGLAAKDATDFARTMQNQKGKLYGDVVVRLLTDDKATKDDVLEGLDWLKQQVTSRDVGIMFVAGHGMNDKLGSYYFLPHNVNPEQLIRTGVSQDDIKRTFANLPGKTIFFVDTCFSGSVLGTVRTSGFINELASAENGAVVFAASTAGQESQENASWGNGAFTKSVVEGLNGKADFRKNGLITAKGLDYYVDDRVKELTKGQQSPVSIAPGGITDFPIAVTGK